MGGRMKSRLSLLACVLLLGCDALIVPPAVDPAKPDKPAVVKSQVTQQQFFAAFADMVEEGKLMADHTQSVKRDCDIGMSDAGVTPPANYESVMAPYLAVNKLLDADTRKRMVQDF